VTNEATLLFFGVSCRSGCWFSGGGGIIGQVEQRGLSKWGGAGSISRLVFYLTFLVDRFGSGMA